MAVTKEFAKVEMLVGLMEMMTVAPSDNYWVSSKAVEKE